MLKHSTQPDPDDDDEDEDEDSVQPDQIINTKN